MENSSTVWTRSRDDGLFALAGVVLCVITYALYVEQLTTNQKILMFIVSLGYTLPTAFRRDNTTLTTAIIICTATLRYFAFPTLVLPMDFMVLLALYTVILCGSRTLGIATGAFVAAGSLIFWVPRVWPFTEDSAIRFCLANSILIATYAVGIARRSRSAIEEELRRSTEQAQIIAERESHLAVVEERGRISRDMHDIVAHTLAVVVAQADGGRYAGRKNPDLAIRSLDTISEVSRDALREIRSLIGALRDQGETEAPDSPQPLACDLNRLVDNVRESGQQISFIESGEQLPLPAGASNALYRICQEALTNSLKYAGPKANITVSLQWRTRSVSLAIVDDGRGAAVPNDGKGNGIVGMIERAAIFGGTLEAHPRSGGGFTVLAQIPIRNRNSKGVFNDR